MATSAERQVLSDLPIPPGETLAEEIGFMGMTPEELAKKTDLSTQIIAEIIRGETSITDDTAKRLEKALGVPAHLWINLEARYQLTKARLKERDKSSLVTHEAP